MWVRFEVVDDFDLLQFVIGELLVPVVHIAADDIFVGVDFQMTPTIAHGTRIPLDVELERFVQTVFKTVEHVQMFALGAQHFGEHQFVGHLVCRLLLFFFYTFQYDGRTP